MNIKVIVTGVIALFLLGIVSPAKDKGSEQVKTNGNYTLIKGRLASNSNDGSWSHLSFGVVSEKNSKCKVRKIEITDLDGNLVAEIDDFDSEREDGITWYYISLRRYNLPFEFLTRIYISSKKGGNALLREIQGEPGAPIDPDETIVVVKWP